MRAPRQEIAAASTCRTVPVTAPVAGVVLHAPQRRAQRLGARPVRPDGRNEARTQRGPPVSTSTAGPRLRPDGALRPGSRPHGARPSGRCRASCASGPPHAVPLAVRHARLVEGAVRAGTSAYDCSLSSLTPGSDVVVSDGTSDRSCRASMSLPEGERVRLRARRVERRGPPKQAGGALRSTRRPPHRPRPSSAV
jgi:hypothetical protein